MARGTGLGIGEGHGQGRGKGRGDIIMGFLWLLVFIFPSFPIAGFCAAWYIILYCLEACACCKCLKGVNDILLQGVQLPNTSWKNFTSGCGCA